GAVLYTHLSLSMLTANGGLSAGTDTTRVAAQIVTGVGFIGAGTILHARGAIVGLTSAATIWVVAAIGVALGSRYYLQGVITALAVIGVLAGLGRVEKIVQSRSMRATITVHARSGPSVVEDIETLVRRTGLELLTIANRHENVDIVIDMELRGSRRLYDQAIVTLLHHDHVRTVSTGGGALRRGASWAVSPRHAPPGVSRRPAYPRSATRSGRGGRSSKSSRPRCPTATARTAAARLNRSPRRGARRSISASASRRASRARRKARCAGRPP